MRTYRHIIALLLLLVGRVAGMAQDIIVNVMPVQEVLPPQVGLYIDNPGNYFQVTLVNKGSTAQQVYLALELEHIQPSDGLSVQTPPRRMPRTPFTVEAGRSLMLTSEQMRSMFYHIPMAEVAFSQNVYSNFSFGGDYGLLPEGLYQARLTAYRWDPMAQNPVAVSSGQGGTCNFRVCYKAQSPTFLLPAATSAGQLGYKTAKFDLNNPLFTWTKPVVACNPLATNYQYTLRIVEVLPGQSPDEAMIYNPVFYQRRGLTVPSCTMSRSDVKRMKNNTLYAAQVKANALGSGANRLNYTMVENEGKSEILLIETNIPLTPDEDKGNKSLGDDDDDDYNEEVGDIDTSVDDVVRTGLIAGEFNRDEQDSLYVVRNPEMQSPKFSNMRVPAIMKGDSLKVRWTRAVVVGGSGDDGGDLTFKYRVELFSRQGYPSTEAAVEGKPLVSHDIKGGLMRDTITWEEIKDKVTLGESLLLRVLPLCNESTSVRYEGDQNLCEFQFSSSLSEVFGDACAAGEIKENRVPISISAAQMKGKTVNFGFYKMEMGDDVKLDSKNKSWSGTGYIEWMRMKVAVGFEELYINSDYIVYEGKATTTSRTKAGASKEIIPESMFTDWGLDNIIGSSTAEELQGKVNSVGKQIKGSKYYDYVSKAYTIFDDFSSGNLDRVYLPLQLPKSINKSPIDIQIVSMEFYPTNAWMNLVGVAMLPESRLMDDNVLVFGAPRVCLNPNRVLPGTGCVCLLSDVTVKDPKSPQGSYSITFKAPKDLKEPNDGCYIQWDQDTLSWLSLAAVLQVPQLKEEKDNKLTGNLAKLVLETRIHDWNDWTARASITNPFQVEDLPGWTFTAKNIIYDHSATSMAKGQGAFPDGYKTKSAGIQATDGQLAKREWQGLYVGEINVAFPKSISVDGGGRLELSGENMFFDKSGVSLDLGVKDLGTKTGKLGGWGLKLRKAALTFVQNDFTGCSFEGDVHVPVLSSDVGFNCKVLNQRYVDRSKSGYAYVMAIQQMDETQKLDFLFATAQLKKDYTYFLLEAFDEGDGGEMTTNVELCLGGDLAIEAVKDAGNAVLKKLPFNVSMPDIHFYGMRVSNRDVFESRYAKYVGIDQNVPVPSDGIKLLTDKQHKFGNSLYFSFGQWSLASEVKKLGPFDFELKDYKFTSDIAKNTVGLAVTGKVGLLDGMISAEAGVSIGAEFKNITDFANLELKGTSFLLERIALDMAFAGIEISGELDATPPEGDKDEGYKGKLKFKMPGDLFTVEASGGYYKHEADGTGDGDSYKWGYFFFDAGSSVGIPITPLSLKGLRGGFYFNCRKTGDDKYEASKGIIGVCAGLTIGTADGQLVQDSKLDLTVVVVKNEAQESYHLSTLQLTGEVKAVSGLVNAKATLLYQNDYFDNSNRVKNRFFCLNLTMDAAVDISNTELGAIESELKKLDSKYSGQATAEQSKAGLSALAADKEEVESGEPMQETEESKKQAEEVKPATKTGPGIHIPLELKITQYADGKKVNKWHLYLGEPGIGGSPEQEEKDEQKRVSVQLINFRSKVVTCKIGANAYLCIGNELPNEGKLPPIPSDIRKFLYGGYADNGMESADEAKANRARESQLEQFQAQLGKCEGGVMFGAKAYGHVSIDLAVLYGSIGATVGFDVSLTNHGDNAYCYNLGSTMGYHNWYAMGQLYAYLYAKFGVRINLGFFKQDIPLVDAGVGAVLQAGMPKPTWFYGKARLKLRLLDGLVNLNRSYTFECGKVCTPFYGNTLDNFELFGDASIGNDVDSIGWDTINRIDPKLAGQQYIYTQAPIDASFRVMDENEAQQLAAEYKGDKEEFMYHAMRTFVFRLQDSKNGNKNVARLYEYEGRPTRAYHQLASKVTRGAATNIEAAEWKFLELLEKPKPKVHTFAFSGKSQLMHLLPITELKANRWYALEVTGAAKEIQYGLEVDPEYFDIQTHKTTNKPWEQTKTWYFCTREAKAIADTVNLQDYVALAYPSIDNQLKPAPGKATMAYKADLMNPTIALTADLSNQTFKKGKLLWRLYDERGTLVGEQENQFAKPLDGSSCVNMQPKQPLAADVKTGSLYRLKLDYEWRTVHTHQEDVYGWKATSGSDKVWTKTGTKTVTVNADSLVCLADMRVTPYDGDWRTGLKGASRSGIFPGYE